MSKLFTIRVKTEWCSIFANNYLLVVSDKNIQIWNLLKNE
jgi:hypothetical protein